MINTFKSSYYEKNHTNVRTVTLLSIEDQNFADSQYYPSPFLVCENNDVANISLTDYLVAKRSSQYFHAYHDFTIHQKTQHYGTSVVATMMQGYLPILIHI